MNLIKLCSRFDKELLHASREGVEAVAFRLAERVEISSMIEAPICVRRRYRTAGHIGYCNFDSSTYRAFAKFRY